MDVPRINSNASVAHPLPSGPKKDVGKPMTSEQRPTAAPFSSPTSTETDAVVLSFPGSRQEDRVSAETATDTPPPATTHPALQLRPPPRRSSSNTTLRPGGIHKLPPEIMFQIMDSVVEGGDMRKRLDTRSVVARVNKEFKGYADASKTMKEDLKNLERIEATRDLYWSPGYSQFDFAERLRELSPSLSREHIDVAAKIRPNSDTEKELSSYLKYQPQEVRSHIENLRNENPQDTSEHDSDLQYIMKLTQYAMHLKQVDPSLTAEQAAMAADGVKAYPSKVKLLRHRLEFKSPEMQKKIKDIRAQNRREEGEDELPYALRLEQRNPNLSFDEVTLAAMSTTNPYYGGVLRLRKVHEEQAKSSSSPTT